MNMVKTQAKREEIREPELGASLTRQLSEVKALPKKKLYGGAVPNSSKEQQQVKGTFGNNTKFLKSASQASLMTAYTFSNNGGRLTAKNQVNTKKIDFSARGNGGVMSNFSSHHQAHNNLSHD